MTYVLLLLEPGQVDALCASTNGAIVAVGDSPYQLALAALRRCTPDELWNLELRDLRRVKRFVAGLESPPPPGPVGTNAVQNV